jgi:cyclopropane fatty-acyl-phospholipid synthase-like methyltransferase
MQREVTRGICNIKNKCRFLPGDHPDRPFVIFSKICAHLFGRGARFIIIGCTDIRVDFTAENTVDSLEVLSKCILEKCMDNNDSIAFFKSMAEEKSLKPTDTKLANKDTSDYDCALILKYADKKSELLDLGSGMGLIVNKIYDKVKNVVAVEIFEKFTQFIVKAENIKIVNTNLFDYPPPIFNNCYFDIITIFGTLHYFNEEEAIRIYRKYYSYLKDGGKIIIKQQFGVKEDVTVSGFSEELKKTYFSQYRHLDKEIDILSKIGYTNIEVVDIYPPEYNKWENTHYFALIGQK